MNRNSPRPFRALLGSELRQLWRSPLPWLLVVAVPAVFFLVGQWQAPALERLVKMQQPLGVLGLALGAFAAWTWQRGKRNGSDEILLAWPLPSWQVGLARTLALGSLTLVCWLEMALPSLAYTAVSYATAARAAGMALPLGQALHDGGLITLSLAASFLGAQALGQLAGALLPGLAALVLLVLYRAVVLLGLEVVLNILHWPYGLLASPEFLWSGNDQLASGLQMNLYTGLFVSHQGFWVLGSLGLLALVVLLFRSRRDAPQIRSRLLAGAALLVTVGVALPYIAVESGFVAAQDRVMAEYSSGSSPSAPAASTPTAVPLSYRLAVDAMQAPTMQVQATVELQAPADAPLDTLTLTLRRDFQIDAVSLDGAAVPAGQWEREDDSLRIRPDTPVTPGQTVTVTIAYHGDVQDWRLDPYETPAALVSHGFVYLPAGWGWYPVPGEQPLTWETGNKLVIDRMQLLTDAEPVFDITVHAPSGITDLTGFDQEQDGSWHLQEKRDQVSLLGGAWWQRNQDGVEYAVPFEDLDTWQESSAGLQRLLAAAEDWTGIAPLTVVPSPASLAYWSDGTLLEADDYEGMSLSAPDGSDPAISHFGQWVRKLTGLSIIRPEASYPPQAMSSPPDSAATIWTQAGYTGNELPALQTLTWSGIIKEAYGSEATVPALPSPPSLSHSDLVDAWAARTPAAAQKEALRHIAGLAQSRPLTPADLAFLKDDGGQS